MFEEFWKSLGGSFDKRWLVNAFGPALVFWGAGLWVWAQLVGLENALQRWQGVAAEARPFLGAAGLLLVFLTAVLLEAFEGAVLRFYEGYWPGWHGLAQRRARDLRQKQERRRVLRTKVAIDQAAPADRAELARLDSELAHRPRDPGRSMPSRMGDVLRTAEDYPRERYGLDPIVFWPRLFPQLSDSLRQALASAQDQLDLLLRLTTLAALHGVAWSVVAVACRRWVVLWWALPALPLAWLLWRSAAQAAVGYAALFRSAFDLHRFDVYQQLHWPPPVSPQTERAHGAELILFLLDGTGAGDVVYEQGDEQGNETEGGKQ
jgi:hypothetical protein